MGSNSLQNLYFAMPVQIQNLLVSMYGARLFRKRYREPFGQILDEVQRTAPLTPEQVASVKFERLQSILRHAESNVPYYSQLFKKIGLKTSSLRDPDDLAKIPLLDKETLRRQPHLFRARDRKASYILQNTSGSTGTPISVHVDEQTYKLAMALVLHHEQAHGVRFGERRATFAGRMIKRIDDNRPPFCRYNRRENQMIFSAYHLSPENIGAYLRDLNRFRPREIIGYPSAIYSLATCIEQTGARLDFTPQLVVTNSETLFDWQREVIEDMLGCKVYDYYGTAEYVVFAGECSHSNYHVNPLMGILEVVDSDGHNCTDTEGEIVCTTLSNRAMPLIRYRIGDSGIVSGAPCGCDSNHDVLKSVTGRVDDIIVTPDNAKIGRLDHIYKGLTGIKEGQIVQKTRTECLIRIVKADAGTAIDEHALVQNFRERVGYDMSVSITYVDAIERGSNGKFRAVVNEVLG